EVAARVRGDAEGNVGRRGEGSEGRQDARSDQEGQRARRVGRHMGQRRRADRSLHGDAVQRFIAEVVKWSTGFSRSPVPAKAGAPCVSSSTKRARRKSRR